MLQVLTLPPVQTVFRIAMLNTTTTRMKDGATPVEYLEVFYIVLVSFGHLLTFAWLECHEPLFILWVVIFNCMVA